MLVSILLFTIFHIDELVFCCCCCLWFVTHLQCEASESQEETKRPPPCAWRFRIPVSGVAPRWFSWGLAGAYQVQAEVAGLPGPTSERRLNYASLSHSLSGFHKCLTCREGQAPSESVHRSLHAAVPTSEKQNANIPARVQLQQPGNQPEEMSGVREKRCSLSVFLDCLFISSLRFSFILLQKH